MTIFCHIISTYDMTKIVISFINYLAQHISCGLVGTVISLAFSVAHQMRSSKHYHPLPNSVLVAIAPAVQEKN